MPRKPESGKSNRITIVLSLFFLSLLLSCEGAEESGAMYAPPQFKNGSEILELTFAGDIMAHNVNYRMEHFSDIYSSVRDVLLKDNLSFANLEFPVNDERDFSTYPRFNAKRAYVEAAIKAGFDVFSLANNHSCDWEEAGIQSTLASMNGLARDYRIHFSGLKDDEEEELSIREIRASNWKIGFISLTQFLNRGEGYRLVYLLDYTKLPVKQEFLDFIRSRAKSYDLFILSFHGGTEYANIAEERKLRFFEDLVEAGVDIVWSHHPHVLQPWYFLTQSDGGRALILSSTGNLISGQAWRVKPDEWKTPRANTADSALFRVFVGRLTNGTTLVYGLKPLLITSFIEEDGDIVVRKLQDLKDQPLKPEWSTYYRHRFEISSRKVLPLINRHVPE